MEALKASVAAASKKPDAEPKKKAAPRKLSAASPSVSLWQRRELMLRG
jgi:hypothetical protein